MNNFVFNNLILYLNRFIVSLYLTTKMQFLQQIKIEQYGIHYLGITYILSSSKNPYRNQSEAYTEIFMINISEKIIKNVSI